MSVHHSGMTPTEVRLGVLRNGYHPTPLNFKIPVRSGWQNGFDLNEDQIKGWAETWPNATNTGILTRFTPCVDLDLLHPELVEALVDHVHDQWIDRGPILRRVGKAPKLLIPFRGATPFKKITRDLIAPDGSEQKIEFLADGQQFAAFGMHPDTNKPYSWHGNYSPLTVIHDDLPYIHQEQAERLVDELVAICERFGYQLKSKQKTSGDGPNEKSHRERSYEGTNWSRIFTGDPVDHDMLRDMAMSLMVGGLSDGCTYNILYARITTAQGVDEERRSKRLKELPDIIKSARAKMSKPELPLPWIITKEWDDVAPPDPEYTMPDRVPRHHVTLFSGEGAAGKSTIGLHLAAAHAYGGPWLNAMPIKGPAIFIDCEDGVSIIHRRLYAVAQYYGCKFKHLIEGGLHLLSLAGEDAVMATATRGNKVEPTPLYSKILQAASDIKPQTIVIASSANVYAGSEIDRAQVNQFVLGLLVKIAIAADGSVILISHPSLTGMNSGSGISGSTQWHNAVRGRMYLKGIKPDDGDEQPDSDLRVLEFKKINMGRSRPPSRCAGRTACSCRTAVAPASTISRATPGPKRCSSRSCTASMPRTAPSAPIGHPPTPR